jgi:RNA-binding protein
MPLDSKFRKTLAAAANRLAPRATIGAGEPSDAVLNHVADTFNKEGLTKVRISTDDRDECRRAAELVARGLGCELLQLIGRVATLYRAPSPPGQASADAAD